MLKKQFYKIAYYFGFRYNYIKLLFKIRGWLGVKSENEKRLYAFYSEILSRKNRLIFDIGANLGERTSVFNSLSEKVIAVEPNRDLVDILKSRFSKGNVIVLDKACASKSVKLPFYIGNNHLVSSLSSHFIQYKKESNFGFTWRLKTQVQTCTIEELISEYGIPDFCKIDVEGFEMEVLSGLSQKIGMISFEFNYPAFEKETLFCLNKLNELGYLEFNFSLGESLVLNFENWIQFDDIYHYFSIHNFPFKNCYGDIYAR